MKALRQFLRRLAVAMMVLVAIVAAFVYSGVYNTSATAPHSKLVGHTLHVALRHSVRAYARGLDVPAGLDLTDRSFAERSVSDYDEMCRTCHGAPGERPDVWMRALYPPGPDLTDAERAEQWTDLEAFWIIKHGIKDTGMPAFGETHPDNELWAITALVRQFPHISPEEYHAMKQRAAAEEGRVTESEASYLQRTWPRRHEE